MPAPARFGLAIIKKKPFVTSAVLQYVFKPHPGADMLALLELIKEAAGMWRAHGANVSLWGVQVGEVGDMVFVARFESAAKLAATLDAINGDPAFMAWRVKNLKAGLATWVRSNQACEIAV